MMREYAAPAMAAPIEFSPTICVAACTIVGVSLGGSL